MTSEFKRTGSTEGRPVARLRLDDAPAGALRRFQSVVEAQPDVIAVVDGARNVTFAGIAAQAAAVRTTVVDVAGADARTGRLEPVGLLHSHDAAAVAALVGILASGHPVLVLDPRTPAPRLRQFVERAGARLTVTDAALAATAGEVVEHVVRAPVAALDEPHPERLAGELWAGLPDPDQVAVVAFTSGSTGRPKLVMNDHRMLVRDAWANSVASGCYDADDVIAHTLPMAFHAGLMVTVAGLVVGTTMKLYDVRTAGIAGLPGWLYEVGATVMHASPAILRAFVGTQPDPAQLAGLRSLTIAGETAHGRDIEAARRLLPAGCTLRNRYGSSETGLIAEHIVTTDTPELEGPLPVGFPFRDTRLALVDDQGRQVPAGEPGVLTVTGRHLASGYWNDEAATTAAFTATDDGTTTYRTSDVGRFDPQGRLNLLGRRDHSVKIRGYLVEPGEVDAALFAIPDVKEAVTVGLPRPGDDLMRLVSYIVSIAERPNAADIRAALREVLPGYMVPETVVFLEALPRTERGKLDRSALPAPPTVVAGSITEDMSEWESVVATLWAQVLGLEEVGLDDDFFELGGDSLAAERLISQVISDLGVPPDGVTSSVLVQAPTVAQFARRLRRKPETANQTLIPLHPEGSLPPLFVVAGGGGLGVAFKPLSKHLGAEQPVYALQAKALERRGIPDWSVRATARRHVASIRTVQSRGPYYLAGHSFGGLVALEMAHQLRAAGSDVDLLVVLDSFPPDPSLHLTAPPRSRRRRLREALGLAATGIVKSAGVSQYWRFHRQSMVMGSRYRVEPWSGRTLVLVADSPEKAERSAWAPHLSGSWELVLVSGDHFSMMREPYAADIARAISAGLAEAREASGLRESRS